MVGVGRERTDLAEFYNEFVSLLGKTKENWGFPTRADFVTMAGRQGSPHLDASRHLAWRASIAKKYLRPDSQALTESVAVACVMLLHFLRVLRCFYRLLEMRSSPPTTPHRIFKAHTYRITMHRTTAPCSKR